MESEAHDSSAHQGWILVATQNVDVPTFWSGEDVTVQMFEGTIFQRDNSGPRVRERPESTLCCFVYEDVFVFT